MNGQMTAGIKAEPGGGCGGRSILPVSLIASVRSTSCPSPRYLGRINMQSSIAHPDKTPATQRFIESHGGRIVIPDFGLDSSDILALHFSSFPLLRLGSLRFPWPFVRIGCSP